MASAEAKHCRGVEPRRGAGRRDLGTRARANICKIQRVSFQSKHLRRSVEPRRDAGRRNLGTRIRYPNKSHSTNKPSAIAALGNKSAPPQSTKKLPPRAPAPNKASQISSPHGRVLVGEVLGERGRLGGREPRLSRGGSLPPRSSSLLPPRSFPLSPSIHYRGG